MRRANALVKMLVWGAIITCLGGCVFYGIWNHKTMPIPPQMAPSVTVAQPLIEDVTEYYHFTGCTEAVESVVIRARVEGFLESKNFTDGSYVKQGEMLFSIEPDSFKANYDRAAANLKSANADLLRAEQDLLRVEEAIKSNAVSEQEVSTKRAQRDMTKAAVMAAEAEVVEAELNLSYTKIICPIDGKISRSLVDVGNLVGANERTELATVVQTNPMYVYFNVNEKLLQENLHTLLLDNQSVEFEVCFSNEENYPHKGILNFIDNSVDSGTGTIFVRGEIDNSERVFLPGMFVRIRVGSEFIKDALLIDEKAVISDLDGKYVYIVNNENVVEKRKVWLGSYQNGSRVVKKGLNQGEKYIIKGLQFARPGFAVNPQFDVSSEKEVKVTQELSREKMETSGAGTNESSETSALN